MSGDGLHKMDFAVRRRHSLRRTGEAYVDEVREQLKDEEREG